MINFIYVLFLALGLTNAILSDQEEWQNFKSLHHKAYSSEEEAHRFLIFKDNLQKIREHNERFAKGETSYQMGLNKFSDLTTEEFKAIYGRGILPRKEGKKPENDIFA